LTCSGSQKYCTACVSGYTRSGWKCESNINVGFSFTLSTTNISLVLSQIDAIVNYLLDSLNLDRSNVEAITFYTIKFGSVGIEGVANTETTD